MDDREVIQRARELCEAATRWPPASLVVRSPETDWMDFIADPERGKLILDLLEAVYRNNIEIRSRQAHTPRERIQLERHDALMASMREGLK